MFLFFSERTDGMKKLFLSLLLLLPLSLAYGGEIKTINNGRKVDFKKDLVKGKYTLIELYADW